MRISPTSPGGKTFFGSSSATTSISMPGSIRPIEPGFSGPSLGWLVPGEQVSVMPQPLLSFMLVLRSKILATSTGKGAPPDPQRRHAGERGGPFDLDVAHHGLDVETLVQRNQIAAFKAAQKDHGQCED